jgi:RNA polymerase sigma-70 factor (ECF subfamily)
MTDPEITGSQSPEGNDNIVRIFPAFTKKGDAILYNDDDTFIKKIFETTPRKAFDLLFSKYYSTLCNHAIRFVFSRQKAEDLVADIFVLFWNNKLYENIKGSYRAYFFSAVRNKCYTYLQWELKKERTDELSDSQLPSFLPTPAEILQASDLHITIERTIKSLPARQQQVFVMSRFEGKKNREIAAALQLSLKTVEMHITRTLTTFRKILEEYTGSQ